MIRSPFEDPDATYCVLINDEGQHSLWPSFAGIPAGWYAVHEVGSRDECLKCIANSWTDIRPNSVRISS